MNRSSLLASLALTLATLACGREHRPLALGFDPTTFSDSVRPQDDFYRYVNGGWLDQNTIPEDKSNYGSFSALADRAEQDMLEIIQGAADSGAKTPGSDVQKIGDYYLAFMDTARIEAAGSDPLRGELDRIDAIGSREDVVTYMGRARRIGSSMPLGLFVSQDEKNPEQYIIHVSQGGLGLPDRDYYLKDRFKDVRAAYTPHIARMFRLAGLPGADGAAHDVMALETRLARAQWPRVKNRNRDLTYNRYDVAGADELSPSLDWLVFLASADVGDQTKLVIRQPDYVTALGREIRRTPVNQWKEYFRWQLLRRNAGLLSHDFVEESFAFNGHLLRGIEQNRPRWKRAVSAVNGALGEMVGKLYVEQHFKPEAKSRMDDMVSWLSRAFGRSIDSLAWMSDTTKLQAHDKLAKFTPKIGYPSKWKDYSALTVDPQDLVGDTFRSRSVEYDRNIHKLGQPIDRTEWRMTPQTVNAYYSSSKNEVVFPAAILQPPFFNVEADDAVNYGAIGAVIGHEFSHGFDDQGRKSDGDGRLRDWWTEQDATEFKARADRLVAQYDEFSPLEGMHVNGRLTLGENIGDLAGLTMAYRAYHLSLGAKEAPVIDGFTGDQRFFIGWAQVWRRLYRENELKRRLTTDPHSPSQYRTNGIVSNIDAFYAAFDLAPGDGMYRPPEDRVHIW